MKRRLLALILLPAVLVAQEAEFQVPTNLFFDVDLVAIIPKWNMSYSVRGLAGAKTTFSGSGYVESLQEHGDFATKGVARGYHDGLVNVDNRRASIDDGTGRGIGVPVTPDGNTNTWSFTDNEQALDTGVIAMHTYTNTIADSGGRNRKSSVGYGPELTFRRDMDKRLGILRFDLLGGIGLNGINSKVSSNETSTTTTLTDSFSLNGVDAPEAPYSAPSVISTNLVDANGRAVAGVDGETQTNVRDTTVMLAQDPESRTTTTSSDDTSVTNHYHLKGAYFTFRVGPTLMIPFNDRLRATMSAGAALVYAGTTYTVQQDFTPDTGQTITSTVERSEANFLPGYYADASLEMTLTERAGAFLGVAYQDNGSFRQSIVEGQVNYATRVKLENLAGVRMGLNIRF
jgi:hypothetical protein